MRIGPHEQDRPGVDLRRGGPPAPRSRAAAEPPGVVATLTDWVLEAARDGRTVADLMQAGRHVLTAEDVMEGIAEMLSEVQVEATFPDGTRLVTLQVKSVLIAWAAMGDANASIPTPSPSSLDRCLAAAPTVAPNLGIAWVASAALDAGRADRLAGRRPLRPVADTRSLGKSDLPLTAHGPRSALGRRRGCPRREGPGQRA